MTEHPTRPAFRQYTPTEAGHNATSVVGASFDVEGAILDLSAFKKLRLDVITTVTGGDRTAGSYKVACEMLASDATVLQEFDILTGIGRFATHKSQMIWDDTLTAIVSSSAAGPPAAGASIKNCTTMALCRFSLKNDAAYSGGTTSPSAATASLYLTALS